VFETAEEINILYKHTKMIIINALDLNNKLELTIGKIDGIISE
jgi:hypothetical protein